MICFFAVLVLSAIFFMMRFKQEDEFGAAVVSLVIGLFIGFIGCLVGHLYGTANMGAAFGFVGGYVFVAGVFWLGIRQRAHSRDLDVAIRVLVLSLEREVINRDEQRGSSRSDSPCQPNQFERQDYSSRSNSPIQEKTEPKTNGADVFSEEK